MAEPEQVVITAPAWQRNIGGLVADATFEEEHQDDLVATEHPVEQGAPISDHMYKRPITLTLYLGWTNSGENAEGDEGYVLEMYQKLIDLQLQPIVTQKLLTITTGKRQYTDMAILSLNHVTTEKTEWSLPVRVVCRQLIIVQTQNAAVPPVTRHEFPQRTAPVTPGGTRQLAPAPNFNNGG